jgi:hypothetical protein
LQFYERIDADFFCFQQLLPVLTQNPLAQVLQMPYTGSHGLFARVGVATNDRGLAEGSIQDQIRVVAQELTLGPVHTIAGWCVTPTYIQVDKWTPGEGFNVAIDQALAQIAQIRLAQASF